MKTAHSWFRFYNTTMDNEKVLRLTDRQFRVWAFLLCVASKKGGVIPDDNISLSIWLRMDAAKVRDIIQALISGGLLERCDGGYVPHDWDKRQYKSDQSNERVSKFRERKRNVTNDDECNVTVTATETPPETETETETETEKKMGAVAPPARKRAPRSLQVEPEGFEEFYIAFPKHVERPDAAKAYRAAVKRDSPEAILAGAKRYAAKMRGTEKEFIKGPGRWLRNDCWKDEPSGNVIRASFVSVEEQEAQRLFKEKLNAQTAQ